MGTASRTSGPTVVIGAGPYGLSAAAHLRARGVETLVFGRPMAFWRAMPRGLCLKSPWSASSLSDPSGAFSLDRFVHDGGGERTEPIPLPFFLRYAQWFQRHALGEIDPVQVECLRVGDDGFEIRLDDGRTQSAARVVVAVGIDAFAHLPDFARNLPAELASHTQAESDLFRFSGRTVAVVGAGQSGLEYAALLREAGADVELIARGRITWVNRALYDTGPFRRVFYPPTDVGPPGLNWLIAFPLLVRHLPEHQRLALRRRATRPAGAKWLRPRVEGQVRLTPSTPIRGATAAHGRVRLELGDGTTREVDHLLLGTGFKPDLEKVGFLDASLRRRIRAQRGFPIVDQWFESSVPGLHFIGAVAGYNFGPLCNFVAGAGVAARRVTRRAAAA